MFGDTKSPSVALFKILKDPSTWNSLDLSNLQFPSLPPSLQSAVPELLSFIEDRLLPENEHLIHRGDYKEFLELSKLYLGGTVERKKNWTYQLSRPGADHHARWMSKAIYILKLSLIGHQLTQSKLSWQKKQKIRLLAPWVVFCYMQYWFLAPSLEDAALNDLKLFTSLQKFNKVPGKLSKKIVTKTSKILQRHTWYLSEELIPISLFSDKVPDEEKEVIAAKTGRLPAQPLPIKKPNLPKVSEKSSLGDFVGPRSTLLFQLLGESHTFLSKDEWWLLPQYEDIKRSLRNLVPLNDSCKRASHSEKFPLKTKKDLKKLL